MDIQLQSVSKRYRREWIFRKINHHFTSGRAYAILGPNGSGKSTLLRTLSGHLTPTKGKVLFSENDKSLELDSIYKKISYTGPYIDLIEELTLIEAIDFHQKFKSFQPSITLSSIIELLGFQKSKDKQIRYFSSGMKQRLKLVLAICSDTPVLLLDEPTTNLDQQGMNWYLELIRNYTTNRLVIIASNVEIDYSFCEEQLSILDYK